MRQIYDMGPTALLSLRRKACWGFFRTKNPTASAGFEPADLASTLPLDHRSRTTEVSDKKLIVRSEVWLMPRNYKQKNKWKEAPPPKKKQGLEVNCEQSCE